MTTETKQTESQLLAGEIDKLQSEIPRLKLERDTLGKIPMLPVGADPTEVAQKISSSVTANAARLRGIDAAIGNLTESLAAKKNQLAQLRQQEEKAAAWEQLDQAKAKMRIHRDRVNEMSRLIEMELQQLRDLEKASGGARWTVYPFQQSYQFFDVPQDIQVPEVGSDDVHFYVTMRPAALPY